MPEMRHLPIAASLLGCVAIGLSMTGCGSEPETPVVTAPAYTPPPPPPPAPRVTPIADLMAELRIDGRIVLPEDKAPDNNPARKAVLEFFDGFARGDANAVRRMLSPLDQRELDAMVESGQWRRSIEGIDLIELETGPAMGSGRGRGQAGSIPNPATMNAEDLAAFVRTDEFREMASQAGMTEDQIAQAQAGLMSPEISRQITQMQESLAAASLPTAPTVYAGDQCALALFTIEGELQAQLWYYQPRGDGFEFQSAPTPPNIVNRLSGTNWIQSWHDIIDEEIMLASKPDEDITPPQQRIEDDSAGGGGSGGSPVGPASPGPRGPSGPANDPAPIEMPTPG